ncbi:MAG: hypothetical protein IKF64_01530 [Eubacterium sp.]|nr:hypothetical protein [Eubacterium sp.]
MKKLTAVFSALALIISVLCAVPVYAEETPVFEDTVYDIQADSYTTVYDETHNPITTATPGTQLFFTAEGDAPEGKYFTDEFLIDGNETVKGEYLMPDHNITVSAILAERSDVTIDISDGSVKEMSEKEYLYSIDMLPQWDGENPSPEITMIDFNNDSLADAKITQLEPVAPSVEPVYTIQLLPEAVGKLAQKFTISPDFGPYKSITFTLNSSPEPPQTYYTVIATAAAGGTADGGFLAAEGATARLTATPDNGYAFDGWYEGDTKVSNAANYSFTVTRNITLTAHFRVLVDKITVVNVTATYGTSKDIVIKVYDINGNKMAGKNVTATINEKSYESVTDKSGTAKIKPSGSLAPKTYSIMVTCESKSVTCKYVVNKCKPKLIATAKSYKQATKIKKYTVTLKDDKGKPIKKAKLTIKVKNKQYKATTNTKGKAIFKMKNLTKKGNFKAKVKFAGNKYYKGMSKNVKINVK